MLGQARVPLVSGSVDVRTRRDFTWLSVLSVGMLLGSAAASALFAVIGEVSGASAISLDLRRLIVVFALVLVVGFDIVALRRGGLVWLGLRRQAPQRLRFSANRRMVGFVWGFDIGTGVSTFRVTTAIWVVSVAVLLHVVPWYVGGFYGLGLAVTLGLLMMRSVGGFIDDDTIDRFMRARRKMQGLYVGIVLLTGWAILNAVQ
ncbi:MAG: hypothetical protein ACRDWI_12225 [Jiangellaceae bacterium]